LSKYGGEGCKECKKQHLPIIELAYFNIFQSEIINSANKSEYSEEQVAICSSIDLNTTWDNYLGVL